MSENEPPFRGYTPALRTVTITTGGLLAYYDLRAGGAHRLSTALGLESATWSGISALVTWVAAFFFASSSMLRAYLRRTVRIYKAEPFLDATPYDVPFWLASATAVTVFLTLLHLDPGTLGNWRAPSFMLLVIGIASVVASLLGARIATALHAPSPERKAVTRKQCVLRYGGIRRCEEWAFRWGDFCRWHFISLRLINRRKGGGIRLRQYAASACILLFGTGVQRFLEHRELGWLFVCASALGAALHLLADSIITPEYVLSLLRLWPKLIAFGLVLEASGAIALLVLTWTRPEAAQSLLPIPAFGPAVLYVVAAVMATLALDTLIERVLFWEMQSIASILAMFSVAALWKLLEPPVRRYTDFHESMSHYSIPVRGITFLAGYALVHEMAKKMAPSRSVNVHILGAGAVTLASMAAIAHLGTGPILFAVSTVALSVTIAYIVLRLMKRPSTIARP